MMYLVSVDYTWKLTRKRSRRGHQSSAFKKNQLYIQADINIFLKKLPLPFSQVQTKQKAKGCLLTITTATRILNRE